MEDMMERQVEIEKIYNLDHRCPILLWSVFWLPPAHVYRLAGDIDVGRLNASYHRVKVLEFPHVGARRLSRQKVTGAFIIMAE